MHALGIRGFMALVLALEICGFMYCVLAHSVWFDFI